MLKQTNVSLTRHDTLKRVTVGGAVVGWSTRSAPCPITGADTTGLVSLPRLDGTLETSPDVLARFSRDFGNLVFGTPRAVLRPGSVWDIVEMVRYARVNGLKIAVTGQSGSSAEDPVSHSHYGQAAVPGGISVDAKALSGIHDIGEHSAWVDAGASWAKLMDAALAKGLMPPAHIDYQHLSIGGTLSVGGIGGQAREHGLQIDTVSEIEIVTGRGYVVRASATERADLFHAVLGGGGQVGIITKARIRLVRAPARAQVFSLYYDDVDTYLADQELLLREGRFDYQAGGPVRGAGDHGPRYLIDAVAYHDGTPPDRAALLSGLRDDRASAIVDDLPIRDWVFRFDAVEAAMRDAGYWHTSHPWLSLVLPGSTVAEFTRRVMAELTSADVGAGSCVLYPFATATLTRPLFKVPDEPVVYLFDLRRLPSPDGDRAAGMLEQNRRFFDLAVELGGRRCLGGAIPGMTPREWRDHFGGDWQRLADAKRSHDPDHVLTPGQGFFGPARPQP